MKTPIALTLTLSHPMGEGTAVGYFLFFEVTQPASAFNLMKNWERFSLSAFCGVGGAKWGKGRGEVLLSLT